jgi:predicted metal-binding protein
MTATLHVCTTCKRAGEDPSQELRPGAQLHAALAHLPLPAGVTIRPVECLSACTQGCAVALSVPGKWSYVYGRLSPADAAAIIDGAALYAASQSGLPPWRERPEIFRKQ